MTFRENLEPPNFERYTFGVKLVNKTSARERETEREMRDGRAYITMYPATPLFVRQSVIVARSAVREDSAAAVRPLFSLLFSTPQ